MTRLALTLLILLSLLPFSAGARAERLGFKGLVLGAPLERVASDPRHECRAVATPLGDVICGLRSGESETIAGAPIQSLHYFFDAGRLTGIHLTVAERDYARITQALAGKYGSGASRTEPIKSQGGASHENRVLTWSREGDSLKAERYSGRLDRSLIRYGEDGAEERIRQRRTLKDPSRDL